VSEFHRIKSYISYWLDAVNIHSLHAPFVYELYRKVLKQKHQNPAYAAIENIREKFRASRHYVEVDDLGSGSQKSTASTRRVSDIATYGITRRKYSEIMADMIDYMDYRQIVELGTSLGINTLYLSAKPNTQVTTFEGSASLVNIANELLEDQRKNVTVIEGNIDKTLPLFLESSPKLDFIYFDANHQYRATLRYFDLCLQQGHDQTCFVFDDIHLSEEMERAWDWIKNHYQVTLTLDLYQIGIVFINPELRKQHYVLEL